MTIFPPELEQRYHGEQHIERLPFIINKPVADELVLGALASKELKPNDVFMGVAGLRALDLLSSAGRESGQRYQHAVLFDVNYRQVKMTNVILQLIKESATPEQFIVGFEKYYDAMLKAPRNSDPAFIGVYGALGDPYQPRDAAAAAEYLRSRMTKKDSFLDAENFAHLKHMLAARAVHTAVLDICDQQRVSALATWLEQNQLQVGDMYVSSMLDFFRTYRFNDYWDRENTQQRPAVCASFDTLLKDQGTLLYSDSPKDGSVAFEVVACPATERAQRLAAIFENREVGYFSTHCANSKLNYFVRGGGSLAFSMRAESEARFSLKQKDMLEGALKDAFAEQGKPDRMAQFRTTSRGQEFYASLARDEKLTPDDWRIIVECINKTIARPEYQAASFLSATPAAGQQPGVG